MSKARNSQFAKGSGCFTCKQCGKRTRNVMDNGDCELCPVCYEKGSCGNSLSDSGYQGDAWSMFDECKTIEEVHDLLEAELRKLRVPPGLPTSVTIIGRNWWRKSAGGNYCTAEIIVNGVTLHKTAPNGGSGEFYIQIATNWLSANGYMPGREKNEPGWAYFRDRMKIPYTTTASDVSRERDL